MAKIYGLFGAITGKLADTVMAVRSGEQIARKYQPIVYNPSSQGQVAQRAKLKAMSQLSAVAAPVIAIPKRGTVSSRNLFTKKNFSQVSFSNNQAEITMTSVQLTDSVVGLPALYSSTRDASTVSVNLVVAAGNPAPNINRVVYAVFAHQDDGKIRFVSSTVCSEAGTNNTFQATIPVTSDRCTILAYGVRDNSEAARVTFGNLESVSAEVIARLVVNRVLTETDVTLTETRGTSILPYSA